MKKFLVKTVAVLTIAVIAPAAQAVHFCHFGNPDDDSHRFGSGNTQREAMVALWNDCYSEFARASAPVKAWGYTYCSGRIRVATCKSIEGN